MLTTADKQYLDHLGDSISRKVLGTVLEAVVPMFNELDTKIQGLDLKIDGVEARLVNKINVDVERLAIITQAGFDEVNGRIDRLTYVIEHDHAPRLDRLEKAVFRSRKPA